jgi:hypothetical protein
MRVLTPETSVSADVYYPDLLVIKCDHRFRLKGIPA